MSVNKIVVDILQGLPVTSFLLLASFLISIVSGFLLSFLYLRGSLFSKIYLEIVRGTPPLLMLLLAYYGLPKLFSLFDININGWAKIVFGILGLSIGWSAYFAEAFRAAYLSVDKRQYEAALSVGMNKQIAFFRIIFPQVLLISLPNVENLVIGLLKATSLVYVIGIVDMYNIATDLANQSQGVYQLEIFIILALIYWLIVILIESIFRWIKKRYQYVTV
ncbi:amino acid ABC transporter permease [Fructilactobacillus frigidiflavus]|uniref:amino acid ABC transporter permease n=1 Tax=Fructilactobacillus frigidiflavus TaxID=3242688 RepID=UPI003757E3B3